MKTAIKVYMLKVTAVITAILMTTFSFFASLVIFYRSVEIVGNMYYTMPTNYVILFGIGFVLIWLVTLSADSAEWIMKKGLERANNLKGVSDAKGKN
jgi:hypothetical protein